MSEVWKDIKGYEGDYMVSNWGNVKRLEGLDSLGHLRKERILKPLKNDKGYLRVQLSKNGKKRIYFVHRLVAQAFIPNPDNLPCINHKDECKSNNNVDNLEWCDVKYNNTYGTRIKQMAEKTSKTVFQYTLDGEFVKEWKSLMEIKRSMGFSAGNISLCCNGKYKTSYGYIWRYRQ